MTAGGKQLLSEYSAPEWVTNVVDAGAARNSSTASSDRAFEDAMAAGGVVEIPAGTYLLRHCQIPSGAGDITLRPLGRVVIYYDGTSPRAPLYFDNTGNTAGFSCGDIETHADFPGSSDQLVSRAVVSTSPPLSPGDVVHLQSVGGGTGDKDAAGFVQAEYAKVLKFDDANNWLYFTRPTLFGYPNDDGFLGYHATARYFTATPKLRIEPGIVFRSLTDTSVTGIDRCQALDIRGAVEPEISVEVEDPYNIAVYCVSVFGGEIHLNMRDAHVDYSEGAFGYGVNLFGACFRTRLRLRGEKCGHVVVSNGLITSYEETNPLYAGVPTELQIEELISHDARRSAWDSHWSYYPRTRYLEVSGSAMDEDESNNNTQAAGGAAVDPWFGNVVCRDVYRAFYLSDHVGAESTWTVDHLAYVGTQLNLSRPIAGSGDQTAAGVRLVIYGGYSDQRSGSYYHLDHSSGSVGTSIDVELRNFNLLGGYRIGRVTTGDPGLTWELHNCTWEADDRSQVDAFLINADAPTSTIKIYDLLVRQYGDKPNGLFRIESGFDVGCVVRGLRQELTGATNVDLVATTTTEIPTRVDAVGSEKLNVKDFGAKGDGTTDDTAAIQAAIDAAEAAGGGTVVVPGPGIYMSGGLTVDGDNVTLYVSPGATLRRRVASTENWLVRLYASNLTLTGGGTLDGNKDSSSSGATDEMNCVFVYYLDKDVDNIEVSHMRIVDAWHDSASPGYGDGVYCTNATNGAYNATNLRFFNNYIEGCQRNGITIIAGEDVLISGNTIHCPASTPASSSVGIDLEPNDHAQVIRDVVITGNIVHGGTAGIEVTGESITVIGNTVTGGSDHGVALPGFIDKLCNAVEVTGNTIRETGGYGIFTSPNCTNPIISNNTIYNASRVTQTDAFINAASYGAMVTNNLCILDKVRNNTPLILLRAIGSSLVDSNWTWTQSGSGTNEYYLQKSGGSDPEIYKPYNLFYDGEFPAEEDAVPFAYGTPGSLAAGEWGWGDNDSLGYSTVYVRLTGGGDPDSQADNHIMRNRGTTHCVNNRIINNGPSTQGYAIDPNNCGGNVIRDNVAAGSPGVNNVITGETNSGSNYDDLVVTPNYKI